MHEEGLNARIEDALRAPSPTDALSALAKALKSEGMTQAEMYRLFDTLRAAHAADEVETIHDAILDTLDVISGWCAPNARLFETELQL